MVHLGSKKTRLQKNMTQLYYIQLIQLIQLIHLLFIQFDLDSPWTIPQVGSFVSSYQLSYTIIK